MCTPRLHHTFGGQPDISPWIAWASESVTGRCVWCERDQNIDDLRRAMRLSHVFRGGIFNPIIPIGRSEASGMISLPFLILSIARIIK
jgi:hypothetical protein